MKLGKRFTALILALVMVLSLTATASAAAAETVTVKLSPNITVTLDGEAQAMADVNGNPVYPVLYGGTTYLPVRAVGNMLGLGVDWDQATQTVLLTTSDSKTEPSKSGSKAPTDAKPTDITVSINPNITVKLDSETQKMTNVNGEPVYPMLYGGTTYLPVRAVSNMLDVDVDWDGTTQTVILESKPVVFTIEFGNGTVLKYGPNDRDILQKDMEERRFIEEAIQSYLNDFDLSLAAWEREQTRPKTDPFEGIETSPDAKVLGENHISLNGFEIDWSTANKGYVRVKADKAYSEYRACQVECQYSAGYTSKTQSFARAPGQFTKWVNVPLWQDDDKHDCVVTIMLVNNTNDFKTVLRARFTSKIDDLDGLWLMSNIYADYENAPNAVAKAKELTQNCKTDAEKIEAVFKFVSQTLTYDHALIASEEASTAAGKSYATAQRDLNPDSILANKKGVCEHYAVLMTAMLRSVGVPCKCIEGESHLDSEWVAHAWVAVKPETGTLNVSGMGDAGDGWIRLDPTNAHVPSKTANDSNYKTYKTY